MLHFAVWGGVRDIERPNAKTGKVLALYDADSSYNDVHHTCLTVEDGNTSADVRKHGSSLTAAQRAHSSQSVA